MKKFFQVLGMISLICFSFFYTERTVHVVREVDEIMIKLRDASSKLKGSPEEPVLKDNTIIPGLSGLVIDEEKSYEAMKRYGSYYEPLLEYKRVAPQKLLKNSYDRYIIKGNSEKKMVSLLFLVAPGDSIDSILNILDKKKVKATFFLDGAWLEDHNEDIPRLVSLGHVVGNLSYHQDYSNSSFVWMDTVIKKVAQQKVGYCYTEEKNEVSLKNCLLHQNYTIIPNIVAKNRPYKEVKDKLSAGSLISLPVTSLMASELVPMIDYIHSRGYTIETLSQHLQE